LNVELLISVESTNLNIIELRKIKILNRKWWTEEYLYVYEIDKTEARQQPVWCRTNTYKYTKLYGLICMNKLNEFVIL